MIHENPGYVYPENNILNLLVGMVIGGLVGALAMLLLAPQSGKDTRKQIEGKSIELRDRTVDMVEDAMAKVRTNTNKITMGLKDQVQEVAVDG
jgi:gas vesicle protein